VLSYLGKGGDVMAEARRDTNPEGEAKINQPKPQKSSYLHKKGESLLFCGDRIIQEDN
jgi:hypothetical protein